MVLKIKTHTPEEWSLKLLVYLLQREAYFLLSDRHGEKQNDAKALSDFLYFSLFLYPILGKRTPKAKEKRNKKKRRKLTERAQEQHSVFLATDRANQ
ncbi:R-spondin-2-like protein [Cricetulus griseus]|nr:R-spondin-2-like protein [Cricetulus griseus]